MTTTSTQSPELNALVDERQLQFLRYLPFGKVLFASSDGTHVVKVSEASQGRQLLRAEVAGIDRLKDLLDSGFRIPTYSLLIDKAELFAVEFKRLDGALPPPLRPPHPPLTPFLAASAHELSLRELLRREDVDPKIAAGLLSRYGDRSVLAAASHGDFVYWNLLLIDGQLPAVLDFEFASASRILGFDDLHYRFAPWWLRGQRWRLPRFVMRNVGRTMARGICKTHGLAVEPDLMLDLFFVHWATIRQRLAGLFDPGSTQHQRLGKRADHALAFCRA